jgi:hypothetical protein
MVTGLVGAGLVGELLVGRCARTVAGLELGASAGAGVGWLVQDAINAIVPAVAVTRRIDRSIVSPAGPMARKWS